MEFPISIREAQASDLDQIYLIIEKNADSCRNISKEMIEERIRNHAGTFLLASLEEQVIGFIIGADLTETSSKDSAFDIDYIHSISKVPIIILSLVIHPDYRGQGFGTLLLAALKESSRLTNKTGLYLPCTDKMLSYFEMNAFIEHGFAESENSSDPYFHMHWNNPYYQEEI